MKRALAASAICVLFAACHDGEPRGSFRDRIQGAWGTVDGGPRIYFHALDGLYRLDDNGSGLGKSWSREHGVLLIEGTRVEEDYSKDFGSVVLSWDTGADVTLVRTEYLVVDDLDAAVATTVCDAGPTSD